MITTPCTSIVLVSLSEEFITDNISLDSVPTTTSGSGGDDLSGSGYVIETGSGSGSGDFSGDDSAAAAKREYLQAMLFIIDFKMRILAEMRSRIERCFADLPADSVLEKDGELSTAHLTRLTDDSAAAVIPIVMISILHLQNTITEYHGELDGSSTATAHQVADTVALT